jgi:ABC-type transport system substrate-binding protein
MKSRAHFPLPSLLAILSLAVAGCTPAAPTEPGQATATEVTQVTQVPEPSEQAAPSVLVFAAASDAITLDPGDTSDGESMTRTGNMFEGLVEFIPGESGIQPCLAESWETSDDGLEITFHLRRGVKFHDGTDLNADAVIFSIRRQYDAGFEPWHSYGEWTFWNSTMADVVERLDKIDDSTVKLILKRPYSPIMTALATEPWTITSPTNAEKWGAETYQHPVGTGPFKFVEWVKDDHITLAGNENYWREPPQLDQVVIRVIPDPSARFLALKAGEIHAYEFPDPSSFPDIDADPNMKVISQPGFNVGFLGMNTGYAYKDVNGNGRQDPDETCEQVAGYHEALAKPEVRIAINYAIDVNTIVEEMYKGTAIVAKNGMPPGTLGYNDAIQPYPYDPEMAKQLLQEAGYPDGFEVTLAVMPVSRPYMFDPPKIGEAIASYLAAVGVNAEIVQSDWATYLDQAYAGELQMFLLGYIPWYVDPDNALRNALSPNSAFIGATENWVRYGCGRPELQELFDKATATYDEAERAGYYEEIQAIVHEDTPYVYLAHGTQFVIATSSVQGFVLSPSGVHKFAPVSLD